MRATSQPGCLAYGRLPPPPPPWVPTAASTEDGRLDAAATAYRPLPPVWTSTMYAAVNCANAARCAARAMHDRVRS